MITLLFRARKKESDRKLVDCNFNRNTIQGKSTMDNVYYYVEMLAKSESGRRLVNILPKLMVTKGNLSKNDGSIIHQFCVN